MKISTSIVTRLNNRYITEINIHDAGKNDHRGIIDNIPVFIDKTLRRGNAISFTDTDYQLSENRFWDIEFFEDYCKNIFFCFKPGFTQKLIRSLQGISNTDLSYFQQTLSKHPTPYMDAVDHPTDPYLHFIGKKLTSLNRKNILAEVIRLDKENRRQLLSALQQQTIGFQKPAEHTEAFASVQTSFTNLLKSLNDSPNNTKLFIQQQLTKAGIPFELFIPKPVVKTSTNKNPDGFNGAVAAMITVFKELGYFKDGISFPEILDAFLTKTGNSIGKLNNFKRNYLADNYYLRYKESLEDLALKKYRENA